MRDQLFPGSAFFSQTTEKSSSPAYAIMLVCCIDLCLQLLPLNETNGNVAFNQIVGLCNLGFYVSYALPVFLKLWFQPKNFPLTKMDLGKWSKPFAIMTSIWLFGTSFVYFLPNYRPIHYATTSDEGSNMNWLIVVVAGTFIIFALNWIFSARYHFTGPKRFEVILSESAIGDK